MRLYPGCERKLPFSVVGPLFWEIVEKRSITLLSQEMSSEDAQDEEEEDGRAEKSDPLLSGYHHYRKIDLRFAAMLQSLLLFPYTISFPSMRLVDFELHDVASFSQLSQLLSAIISAALVFVVGNTERLGP